MADRLSESANLSAADRERARELVGNDSEYAELAAEYTDVTNRSGSPGASRSADFAAAGQLQREFLADVEQYQQVHATYRDARADNASGREVRLAHDLERQVAEINRTAVRLNATYANISESEQGDLRSATRTIGELRANVTETQRTVRDQSLVRTTLSVRATEPGGSFTEPVPLAGQLLTGDGDPVADENVTLRVGGRALNVTTDGEGRFEVAYRPTAARMGDRNRTVSFRPGNQSRYLRADASVAFDVRQTTPNVTISNRIDATRYNETMTVNGTVAAGTVGVPNVAVVVSIDGARIARVRTGANGSFATAGRLPGNVSNGTQAVEVQVVPENASELGPEPDLQLASETSSDVGAAAVPDLPRDLAIAPANATATVTVETTPTALSIADVRTFNGTALVAGELATEGGQPLPNRTVELRLDGRSVGNATTNASGQFATTVGLPSRRAGGDSTVEIVAAFSPSEGNLAPAAANRTATLDATGGLVTGRQLRFGLAGLLVLAVFAGFVWRYRSSAEGIAKSDREADPGAGAYPNAEAGPESASIDDLTGRSTVALLDSATTALADGRFDAAVAAAYGAVRRRFEAVGGPRTTRTHWEFYADCRNAGLPEERLRELELVTETYEHAAFADESVAAADAHEAVADARTLVESADLDAEPPVGARSETDQSSEIPEDATELPTD
ncbi:hypothetical protein [Halorussus litoreus]|uniref:hypothetical protein n=1 Tax=Halorussus litoreus TaxID=1710536 RepID=UPI000E21E255|nr:hypothetical protein [Halorussus litoreus]